jgi:hypothetical protein
MRNKSFSDVSEGVGIGKSKTGCTSSLEINCFLSTAKDKYIGKDFACGLPLRVCSSLHSVQ